MAAPGGTLGGSDGGSIEREGSHKGSKHILKIAGVEFCHEVQVRSELQPRFTLAGAVLCISCNPDSLQKQWILSPEAGAGCVNSALRGVGW